MLSDDIKIIDFLRDRNFFPDDNGAWNRIKTVLNELDKSPCTGSPKFPTFEEVDGHVGTVLRKADGYDDWQSMAVREAYEFIERKILIVSEQRTNNNAVTPPKDRDCDTCENDGDCFVTMLKCKGYVRATQ
jgi:hypothetical protein